MSRTPIFTSYDAIVQRVFDATWETAYSFSRYGADQWLEAGRHLLAKGYTEEQAAAILLSKITRWAADVANAEYGHATAQQVIAYVMDPRNERVVRDVLAGR